MRRPNSTSALARSRRRSSSTARVRSESNTPPDGAEVWSAHSERNHLAAAAVHSRSSSNSRRRNSTSSPRRHRRGARSQVWRAHWRTTSRCTSSTGARSPFDAPMLPVAPRGSACNGWRDRGRRNEPLRGGRLRAQQRRARVPERDVPLFCRRDPLRRLDTGRLAEHGYQVHVGPMYSNSRGSVKIRSRDPG